MQRYLGEPIGMTFLVNTDDLVIVLALQILGANFWCYFYHKIFGITYSDDSLSYSNNSDTISFDFSDDVYIL